MPARASWPPVYALRCTSSYLSERQTRSMKTLSIQRPRPSIEMRMPAAWSWPVKAALVNCAPLVGVEDIGRAEACQRLLERLHAEGRVHRIRQPPCQHRPAGPVDDRHQIEKALRHRNVGDIRGPHMAGP